METAKEFSMQPLELQEAHNARMLKSTQLYQDIIRGNVIPNMQLHLEGSGEIPLCSIGDNAFSRFSFFVFCMVAKRLCQSSASGIASILSPARFFCPKQLLYIFGNLRIFRTFSNMSTIFFRFLYNLETKTIWHTVLIEMQCSNFAH